MMRWVLSVFLAAAMARERAGVTPQRPRKTPQAGPPST